MSFPETNALRVTPELRKQVRSAGASLYFSSPTSVKFCSSLLSVSLNKCGPLNADWRLCTYDE